MREHELGKIQPGYYADCILVNGDPLEDIEILQDHDRLDIIMINGRVHKAGRKEYLGEEKVRYRGLLPAATRSRMLDELMASAGISM